MQQAQRDQRAPLRRFPYSRKGYEISEVDQFVTEVGRQLVLAQQRVQLLEEQLDQLSHENQALTQMINHVARLGEQMVAEARQEANDIISGARSEAQERVVVARADAKTLVSEERMKVANELEMLAVVRETVVRERDALLSFQTDLNGRLREIVTSIVNYSHDDEIHELAAIGGIISPELAPSRSSRPPAPELAAEDPAEDAVIVEDASADETGDLADDGDDAVEPDDTARPASGDRYPDFEISEMHADEKFDRAFSSFMGSDHDAEPSRKWMINGE
jgi:cell division septum initiation protein DivIVA